MILQNSTGKNLTAFKNIDISPEMEFLEISFESEGAPVCVMSLRKAGGMGRNDEPDTAERKRILEELGIEKIYRLRQTHSRTVFDAADLEKENSIKEGDGIYTFSRENVLEVTVADCMPVFFYSRSASVFGVLHSGWKGTGISIEALNLIQKKVSVSPQDFEFILGPSIGSCCYEVDRERGGLFRSLYGSDSVRVIETEDGNRAETKWFLDLRKANMNLLEQKGVRNIKLIENCTCCSENFYSFRGDGPKHFRLMLALIGYFR